MRQQNPLANPGEKFCLTFSYFNFCLIFICLSAQLRMWLFFTQKQDCTPLERWGGAISCRFSDHYHSIINLLNHVDKYYTFYCHILCTSLRQKLLSLSFKPSFLPRSRALIENHVIWLLLNTKNLPFSNF